MNERSMVVVGAGLAGVHASIALRQQGWSGGIVLIDGEGREPYDRPPLSKSYLGGAAPATPIVPRETFGAEAIELLSGVPVAGIDLGTQSVDLIDGRAIQYERLLLATGADARRLPASVDSAGRYLRTEGDAGEIRQRLLPGSSLTVVGAGFLGLEIASSAAALGVKVTVVETAPRILGRVVPEAIASIIAARHAHEGVVIRCSETITAIFRSEGATLVHLGSGEVLHSDAVVVSIGSTPRTQLATGAGLAVGNGILVDGCLRTLDPNVFAAGDCCAFPHPLFGGRVMRLESWRNALDQGVHAARAMLGAPDEYARVPWFWSDQYDLGLQIAGLPDPEARSVHRIRPDGAHVQFDIDEDGTLIAASAVGTGSVVAKDVRVAEMLIERRATPDLAKLADASMGMKEFLR